MNVLKIVVNEIAEGVLSGGCVRCRFSTEVHRHEDIFDLYCIATGKIIKSREAIERPSWCSLVVENDTCVWVLRYQIDDAMWDIEPSCRMGEYSMNKPKHEICPNCEKKIEYKEE